MLELFLTFFKIGLFTFGGGYAMLPMIQEEVLAHGWMPLEDLINFVAVSESTPGPFAINIATFVGFHEAGYAGAAFATLGVVLPSLIVISLVARIVDKFSKNIVVRGCMKGLKPVVVGLIASAVLTMILTVFPDIKTVFTGGEVAILEDVISLLIMAAALFLVIKKKVSPILVLLGAAVVGIICGYVFDLDVFILSA